MSAPTLAKAVSIVIPCLNEARTLPLVLARIATLRATAFAHVDVEVIVSDNGSTDDSVRIAEEHGARVVQCPVRGYGAALQYGIMHASHDVVCFADADGTYDFLETPVLVAELEKGYDLVLGSRLRGTIHPGAMPLSHQLVGTPVLTWCINMLYGRKGARISDCNSGFRCFRKSAFLTWRVTSPGMEFASEMLVKALKAGAAIAEVPISLHVDQRGRPPHLKKWRDGMRHLLHILLEAPFLFSRVGITLLVLGWLVIVAGMFGPVRIGWFSIFGLHSMMFGLLTTCVGLSTWAIGLFLAVRVGTTSRIYRYLTDMSEDRLFWYAVLFAAVSAAFFVIILIHWGANRFSFLALERHTLLFTAFGINGLLLTLHVITAHLIKRT